MYPTISIKKQKPFKQIHFNEKTKFIFHLVQLHESYYLGYPIAVPERG